MSESELLELEKKGLIKRTLSNGFQPTWYLTELGEAYADELDRKENDTGEQLSPEEEAALEDFVQSLDDWNDDGFG